jgi:ring-1,2-phenylacetyl-CoA epoxidase subunit PaaD
MISPEQIYEWLETVTDPEVPVLSIIDLGIVRDVKVSAEDSVQVTITPTYSGCPAMDVIAMSIRMALLSKGIRKINIDSQLSPAWTTDWMSEAGKRKLVEYGIAPPYRRTSSKLGLFEDDNVPCPRCGSEDTVLSSQFGPTSCKSLYKCNSCKEPFEHFKCH